MPVLRGLLLLLLSVAASAVNNTCLDPASNLYKCNYTSNNQINLDDCGITNNDLGDVSTCLDVFGRDQVTRVYMRYNSLTTVWANVFEGLGKLERIYLSHNLISKLPAAIFQGLEMLQWLYLDENVLSALPEAIFQGLGRLERLSLSQNSLTTLPAELFSELEALQELSLANNPDLQCVPVNVAGTLDVDGSFYEGCGCTPADAVACPDGVFCVAGQFGYTCATPSPTAAPTLMPTGFPSPAPTSMPTRTKNPCLSPGGGAYMCSPNGTELTLDYCGIGDEDLPDVEACLDAFGRGTATRVNLRFNYLTMLTEDIFRGLGQVDRLYLNNNALSSLPTEIFQSLGRLEVLNLNGNSLTSLSAGLFQGLGQLEHLWVNLNRLTTLPAELFDGLVLLQSLDLRLNPGLQCVPRNDAAVVEVSELSSGGCGCSLSSTLLCDAGTTCTFGRFGYTCATPAPTPAPVLPGNNTCLDPASDGYVCTSPGTEIDFSYCGLTNDNLVEVADCLDVFGRDNVTRLYLRYNYLTFLQTDLFDGCGNLEHLYLNDNGLTTLPAEIFQGLGKLKVLNMNRNSLAALPETLFEVHDNSTAPVQLQELWMNMNLLTTLPDGLFQGLQQLEILDLRLNPGLQCVPRNYAVTLNVDDDLSAEMCECTPAQAVMCPAGVECVPGVLGYVCGV